MWQDDVDRGTALWMDLISQNCDSGTLGYLHLPRFVKRKCCAHSRCYNYQVNQNDHLVGSSINFFGGEINREGDCATGHGYDYAPGGNLKVKLAAQNSGLSLSGVLRKLTEGPKTTLAPLAVPTHTSQVACVKLLSFSPSPSPSAAPSSMSLVLAHNLLLKLKVWASSLTLSLF